MQDQNKLKEKTYIFFNIVYGMFGLFCYSFLCFNDLVLNFSLFRISFDTAQSYFILFLIMFSFMIIGILLTYQENRNFASVIANVLFPLALYNSLVIINYSLTVILVELVLILLIFLNRLKSFKAYFKNKIGINVKEIKASYLIDIKNITTYMMSLSMVFIIVISATGSDLQTFFGHNQSITPKQVYKIDSTLSYLNDKLDVLINFDETYWQDLTVDEKKNTLMTVLDIETQYLGLGVKPLLLVTPMTDDYVGFYDNLSNTVYIDTNHLKNDTGYEVLDTLCHEMYHAYEYLELDLYMMIINDNDYARFDNMLLFYNAYIYSDELTDEYISADTDYESYYWQLCESNSRSYAENSVLDYQQRIDAYLIEKGLK